jgi:hypothetical protein
MPMLELVNDRPDWMSALGVALTRPPGVAERRGGDDPWEGSSTDRPRRISDDLAWLRQAVDEPEAAGLRSMGESAAVAAWLVDAASAAERLDRLRDRRVLDAAGFLLHDDA